DGRPVRRNRTESGRGDGPPHPVAGPRRTRARLARRPGNGEGRLRAGGRRRDGDDRRSPLPPSLPAPLPSKQRRRLPRAVLRRGRRRRRL
ncbi:MAG: hypothetical protein AVDCRST_MAG19-1248, partial [uncultured Thermomicrobiales bacterium]